MVRRSRPCDSIALRLVLLFPGVVVLQELCRDRHALLAAERLEVAAQSRSRSGHEGATYGVRDLRGNTAGGIEGTTFPVGSAPGTEGSEVSDGSDRSAIHDLVCVQNGLSAVQPFGWTAKSIDRELDDGHGGDAA